VRSEEEYFDEIQDVNVTKDMPDLANHLVDSIERHVTKCALGLPPGAAARSWGKAGKSAFASSRRAATIGEAFPADRQSRAPQPAAAVRYRWRGHHSQR
jgi:hypothetical protein